MPSHLNPKWKRFALSEVVMASQSPNGKWLVLYETHNDNVLAVLNREEVKKLMEHLRDE